MMKLFRCVLAVALSVVAGAGLAQEAYPSKPVRILIPYAPGGGVDAAARLVAQSLSTAMGQNFVVESRPGGNTVIAAEAVARAAPDGYTLLLTGGSTMTLLPLTQAKLPFVPLNDFAPVGQVSRLPYFLAVSATQPYKSAKDLLADPKARDGSLAYASNGIGSMAHIGTEALIQRAGAKMIHVPYNGFTPAIADLVTGRTVMVMADLAPLNAQIQDGKLRPLAVASEKRSPFLPDVPTLAEAGFPGTEFEVWLALYAPAKTPRAVLDKLSAELNKVLANTATREAFVRLGHEADYAAPDAVRQRIQAEQSAFAPAVRAAGLAAQNN
ncbi:tripartite tricarboxylate transporter substrate binding protein [uncultured Pseudacidovorax sp.]|uniref:Bug family tripartite tricarboxylate transporter substrate binding protein n=1 Tax=uncultured Pseudacidovorax sp. TaxID=679313 RepID=UPI0025EAFB5E|nr:tripartite tricarboxylate transporter substrate binding protein [uncultured Pseudacidovorax sp.]